MTGKDSFIIYKSFYGPISGLSNEQLGKLFRALFEWQIGGENGQYRPDDDIKMAFGFFVNQFRIDDEKYKAKCENNRANIRKRWGSQSNTNVYERIQPHTNDTDNDNDNENGNGNGNKSAKASTLVLPFSSREFADTWKELRSQPKWKHKTQSALQRSLNKLAVFDEEFAIQLMDTAIANGTQGLVYENTSRQYAQWKQNRPTVTQRLIDSTEL